MIKIKRRRTISINLEKLISKWRWKWRETRWKISWSIHVLSPPKISNGVLPADCCRSGSREYGVAKSCDRGDESVQIINYFEWFCKTIVWNWLPISWSSVIAPPGNWNGVRTKPIWDLCDTSVRNQIFNFLFFRRWGTNCWGWWIHGLNLL
jgi:hypothetical protein